MLYSNKLKSTRIAASIRVAETTESKLDKQDFQRHIRR